MKHVLTQLHRIIVSTIKGCTCSNFLSFQSQLLVWSYRSSMVRHVGADAGGRLRRLHLTLEDLTAITTAGSHDLRADLKQLSAELRLCLAAVIEAEQQLSPSSSSVGGGRQVLLTTAGIQF